MGESSGCIGDELVLVPPRRHRLKLASPGGHSLVGGPAPGGDRVVRLLAWWVRPPAASRTSWCSSLPGGTGLSSPLPGVIVFVGAPAPGANSVAIGLDGRVLLLHRGRAGARPSRECTGSGWRSAGALHPGGIRCLGTSSPRAAIELDEFAPLGRRSLVGAPAPGANSVARLLARWTNSPAAPRTSWCSRSEERRVGKEWRARWWTCR